MSGEIFGDNYGFGEFRNGQSTFATYANRVANGEGTEDDQVSIKWATWNNSVFYWHGPVTLEYDTCYQIGLAWGGPGNNYETWVSGELLAYDSQSGATLPWGFTGSATNVGLGDNHERGYGPYGSAAGVTFADIRIWDEYRPQGDTEIESRLYLPLILR